MHLMMRDLLKQYNSLNDSLKKNFKLIENKWLNVLKENNIHYSDAYIYETGWDPRDLELNFHLRTIDELTLEERNIIEKEACCRLTNHDEEVSMLNYNATGKAERYLYTFTPFKIVKDPIEDSWLKD